MDEAELAAAATANFLGSFAKLVEHGDAGEVRDVGGVFAFVTGHPISLFNGCVVTEQVSAGAFEDALAWVREHDVPHRAWIVDGLVEEFGSVALEAGLRRGPEPYPNMVLRPVPEAPAPAEGVSVVAVDRSSLDALLDLSVALGMPRDLAERVFVPGLLDDPDVRLFVGSLDGRPAGTSLAIRTGETSGVYNVGTVAVARRRGVASAATWAAVSAGREWGCDVVVLQSTAMALSMYEAIGFRTIATYAMFMPAV